MTDIGFDIDKPSVIHIRNIANYSLGYEIDNFLIRHLKLQYISGSMQEKSFIISLLGHTLHQASNFLVVRSIIYKPQK